MTLKGFLVNNEPNVRSAKLSLGISTHPSDSLPLVLIFPGPVVTLLLLSSSCFQVKDSHQIKYSSYDIYETVQPIQYPVRSMANLHHINLDDGDSSRTNKGQSRSHFDQNAMGAYQPFQYYRVQRSGYIQKYNNIIIHFHVSL